MNEEYQRIINLLEEEANTEQAFFSFEYGKKSINQTEMKFPEATEEECRNDR